MTYHLIICQSEVTAKALETWRDLLGGEKLHGAEQMPAAIVFDLGSCSKESGAIAYQLLVQRIEFAIGCNSSLPGSSEVIAMVDSVHPRNLSVISEEVTWDHLIAALVLTFPEIRWIFGVIQRTAGQVATEDHNLSCLLTKPRREPLLDPTGLREWVKSRTNVALEMMGNHKEFKLPERSKMAASVDEEAEFAFMHGYAAYRYGFRADVVMSWSLMESLFGAAAADRGGHKYSLIIEDLRLNFYDKPAAVHLSRLKALPGEQKGRSEHCPCLDADHESSDWRFLVTTGQMGDDKNLVVEYKDALDGKRKGRGDVLYKPVGGLVDLWRKTNLVNELKDPKTGTRAGNAEGFIWPPTFHREGAAMGGHGSPGKLSLIATTLLRRAREIRKEAVAVPEFIKGAVLSMDATELLGGKTPTLTLSGLALKHEFEVKAECAFLGAGYHFGLKRRIEELNDEVAAITQWFYEKNQGKSALDASTSILNLLVLVFREAGRVEEEEQCLVVLRRLNRKMSAPKNRDHFDLRVWFEHPFLFYGEWLLGSFWHIALLTVIWVVLLACAAWWVGSPTIKGPIHATSAAAGWFFGGSTYTEDSKKLMILSWVGVIAGVFHLGILISYFYSLIARK
jgi:hypothetical protein